jgi:predicted ABC-type ATPase
MPHVVVIAGPNGAGKSTAAPALLDGRLGIENFVNADVIAKGLSAFNPEAAAIQAGRVMLERIRELAGRGEDFAFETTLASRSFAPWIATLREEAGYEFDLRYLWVPAPEMAVARVAGRVRAGGHFVPDDVVARRYRGGITNFFSLYRPIADEWKVYDNSPRPGMRLIAEGQCDAIPIVYDPPIWARIQEIANS